MIKIYLTINLKPKNGLVLPIHYNHIVQSAIYNSIDSELAAFLHKKGFLDGKRSFKMFAFSILYGPYTLNTAEKLIEFTDKVKLTISSPLNEFCQSLVDTLLTRGCISLGGTAVEVEKVYAQRFTIDKEEVQIRTLSPVVLYSTLLRPDGRKYTCYFQPGEPDYDRLLDSNLQKKYRALYNADPPAGKVAAKALGRHKLNVINYKGTVIKGYSGRLSLTGPIPLLQLAVDGGLGGKNAQGFGCVEVMRRSGREIIDKCNERRYLS